MIVTTNMFGDILSDEASELCGSWVWVHRSTQVTRSALPKPNMDRPPTLKAKTLRIQLP